MNISEHILPLSPPLEPQGTETRLGVGVFQVTRVYAGNCPVSDLLRQRILQVAETTSSIDDRIGTAV